MEHYYTIALFLLILVTVAISFISTLLFRKSKLPPGPTPWPIIGNIHMLGNKPHSAIADLSKTYGPIMSLKLGSITTIVISSPETAQEMFLKHDLDFSGRGLTDATRTNNHHLISMVFLPICPLWRKLRKIATVQLFTTQRLDSSQALRKKKVNELVDYARQCSESGLPVNIGPKPWPIIGNILKLGDKPHLSVAELSGIYGPIMALKLGSITTIVISSPEIAKEMFLKHDLVFSSRIIQDAVRPLNHDKLSIVWLPVCHKWRQLRKILSLQLFTSYRLMKARIYGIKR
ncbi:hypothetical protein SOVF_079980 [Spinacia oleracea]|nr:hypothetical protein SOVF_079980 [Spinacia oleracea]